MKEGEKTHGEVNEFAIKKTVTTEKMGILYDQAFCCNEL